MYKLYYTNYFSIIYLILTDGIRNIENNKFFAVFFFGEFFSLFDINC